MMQSKPVALITGASSGMGKHVSLRLLEEGYMVYGAARRVERMAEIQAAGGRALSVDVTDDAAMVAAVEQIIQEQGRIDVLVNNAGYGQYGALEDVPLNDARRQMEVNLFGLARLTQLCLPHMRARRSGRIINISSIGGKAAFPLGGWYHASKFAVEGYSDSLRMEVRPFGIDVVVVEPGGIESEGSGVAVKEAVRLSAQGPYAGLVSRFRAVTAKTKVAPTRVIADLIIKALRARTPRTRYHAGAMAGVVLLLRRRLSDRLFDRLVLAALKAR